MDKQLNRWCLEGLAHSDIYLYFQVGETTPKWMQPNLCIENEAQDQYRSSLHSEVPMHFNSALKSLHKAQKVCSKFCHECDICQLM